MRSSPRGAALLVAFAVVLGCKSKGERKSQGTTEEVQKEDAAPAIDAGPRPTRESAAAAIRALASALDGEDLSGVRNLLRVPEDLSDDDVAGFLEQLISEDHLSAAGLEAVLELDFGPASERFGDAAAAVAQNAEIPLEQAWAFGGPEASVLLVWNGRRFEIVAFSNLTSLAPEATQPRQDESDEAGSDGSEGDEL